MATWEKKFTELNELCKNKEREWHTYREAAMDSIKQKDNYIEELDERIQQQHARIRELQKLVEERPVGQVPAVQQVLSSANVGTIEGFERKTDWNQWLQRFEHYMSGNAIAENRRKELFLNLLGSEGYGLMCSLCAPEQPGVKEYEVLVKLMTDHLKPKPSIITERYKFNMCDQVENQSVSEYFATLKNLSTCCEFGVNLNDAIRDRFVCGLKNKATKKKLLAEKNLTHERAFEVAISDEAAIRDTGEIDQKTTGSLNYVQHHRNGYKKNSKDLKQCSCCGRMGHERFRCRYKDYDCNVCKIKGHLSFVCRSNKKNSYNPKQNGKYTGNYQNRSTGSNKRESHIQSKSNGYNYVNEIIDLEKTFDNLFTIDESNVNTEQNKELWNSEPIKINLTVERNEISFEVDTGSPISAISIIEYKGNPSFSNLQLCENSRKFKSYIGTPIIPLGVLNVVVEYHKKCMNLDLFVMPGSSGPIVGREWIRALKIPLFEQDVGIKNVSNISTDLDVDKIRKEFPTVFSDKLGLYKKGTFKLELKENSKPIFIKPRVLPYAMVEKVENEITRLEKEGILYPVKSSDWATPIVPVIKSNGQIRLCGDYKTTLNKCIKVDRYPIPRISDLLVKINEGKVFSKLDLSHAYQQVELDKDSQLLTTISTHKGLYAYKRLCFGVASAPGLFQRLMEKLFTGTPGVIVFFDDILIFGSDNNEHNVRLLTVLKKLEEVGLTAKFEKCNFFTNEVNFLGFKINQNGVHALKDKVKAIIEMKVPENVTELKRFLGMANYYAKFVKNFTQTVAPLYELLKNDVKWLWSNTHQLAFDGIKKKLLSSEVLMHYVPSLPIKITCDASPVGVGAVLSHILPNNEVKPIAFFSRSLTQAEKNYSQLDREALALVFGVKSCHQFVWGRKFLLETDHKPLKFIFDPNKSLPTNVAGRVQRWAVFLSAYDFDLEHIRGKTNWSADCLSRAPILSGEENSMENDCTYLNFIESEVQMIDVKLIKSETIKDEVLCEVMEYVKNGWPSKVLGEVENYKRRGKELYLEDSCIMLGNRVVIPKSLRAMILRELHTTHMGIVKMKSLARSFVWWPGIDDDIDKITKQCSLCLENSINPPRAELSTWKWPEGPNMRVHIDFLQIDDQMYLVIIDAFSKWIDVKLMKDITSRRTISVLQEYFATWGFPVVLVSDNGPSLVSEEFEVFLRSCGILHVRTAPYHPASNGAAENLVKTFKRQFKLLVKEGCKKEVALYRILLCYRSTPHCTTGCTPAELHIGRPLRTKLDLIRPNLRNYVIQQQLRQQQHAPGVRLRSFEVGDVVVAKDVIKNQWVQAEVGEKLSAVTYSVKTVDGRVWKRHINQLKSCLLEKSGTPLIHSGLADKILVPSELGIVGQTKNSIPPIHSEESRGNQTEELSDVQLSEPRIDCADSVPAQPPSPIKVKATTLITEQPIISSPKVRRSERVRKPVERLDL